MHATRKGSADERNKRNQSFSTRVLVESLLRVCCLLLRPQPAVLLEPAFCEPAHQAELTTRSILGGRGSGGGLEG